MYVTLLILMIPVNVGKIQQNSASLRLSLANFRLVNCVRFHIHVAGDFTYMWLCSACACKRGPVSKDGTRDTNGRKLKHAADGSRSHCYGLFKLHIVDLFCAAFSECCAVAVNVVGFCYVYYISLCCLQCPDVLLSLLSLFLSLASSMVDTMLPLLNWTFHFISVGRSKGSDHFIFIIIIINLPCEIFMYPRGIVDSDEYGPDDNLMLLTTTKKKANKQKY